ncbi:dihydroorotate dehydrogenase electron transfer subunit [Salipaludibacillus aurantiacus]|uniref:Dihydroorotate dehydrogenase B (NAD(+)), electron transfer subunit n=1 Tax=Salipaludibacillus aurantiacus TaxID=1601833 RepID=A0A1H9QRZ7_9BACI|nr:dihydroorotate dehydrogenase electron transfer subunit [Salipaludibacillus aurantiacus]SER63005.1 dihydroorotate dehydrogenase electron transfer subunit [Salipaludibacillus aurantiacus]
MIVEQLRITGQEEIAPRIYRMTLEGDSVQTMTEPGQFVHVKVSDGIDPLLRRPISICDVSQDKQELTIIYRAEGRGTRLLAAKKTDDTLDVLGPLGQGFPLDSLQKGSTALLVGGGVGIPPLYYLAKKLVKRGVNVRTILGFRQSEDIFLQKEFRELGDIIVTTEDGSKGVHGFVTDAMNQAEKPYDSFFTCGPVPMLRAVKAAAASDGFISLEERMGCGVGACLACVCEASDATSQEGKKYRKICSDGPVFRAGEVVI